MQVCLHIELKAIIGVKRWSCSLTCPVSAGAVLYSLTMQGEGVDLSVSLSRSPSSSAAYTSGSEVTGEVTLIIGSEGRLSEGGKYKRVTVSVLGKVDVYFSTTQGGGGGGGSEARHFTESEVFFKRTIVLWEEGQNSTALNEGRYIFPFSLPLQPDSSPSLPSSLDSRDAKIKYNIEAKLIRSGVNGGNEIESSASLKRIEIQNNVDINRSDFLSPRSAQKEILSGCIGRGAITVTATVPRTGYCRVVDQIPVQVLIEPGRSVQLQYVSARLVQRISCHAQGQMSVLERLVSSFTNTHTPRKGVSFTWNVPHLVVPDQLELTMDGFSFVQIRYFVRVEYGAKCSKAQFIDLPVVIGNIPLSSANSSRVASLELSRTTSGGGGYQPAAATGYTPPVVPTAATEEKEEESTEYSRLLR